MNFLESATLALTQEIFKEVTNPTIGFEGIDPDEHLYRSLTESPRDIPRLKQERLQNIAFFLYLKNPVAYRITDLTKDFTIGKGIKFKSDDERVQEILDEHWEDPANDWDNRQHDRVTSLGLYGELFTPVFVNEQNGDVQVGGIDPLHVSAVLHDEQNAEMARVVVMKSRSGHAGKKFDIVTEDAESGFLNGEIIVAQLKRVPTMTRGVPDMAAALDYLDMFDSIMFGEMERLKIMRAYTEDIEMIGAGQKEIEEARKNFGDAPKFGSRFFHNQNLKRQFLSPKVESSDLAGLMKMILAIILGCQGIPEHYFALAYDINRATAQAMDPPLIRRIETRQRFVRAYFKRLFSFVLSQAVEHSKVTDKGVIKESEFKKLEFDIIFPDPSTQDIKETAAAIVQLSNALVVAQTQEWVSDDTAREIWSVLADEFGVEVNAQKEKEIIEEQRVTESLGIYAARELKDFIAWFQESNGENAELRQRIKLAVIEEAKKKRKKKKEYSG